LSSPRPFALLALAVQDRGFPDLDRGFAAAEDEEEEQNLQRFFCTIQSLRCDTFRFFFPKNFRAQFVVFTWIEKLHLFCFFSTWESRKCLLGLPSRG
jgi:hypothetical protein